MKTDFYLFARYIYADIAVVHLELLSVRPYAIYLPHRARSCMETLRQSVLSAV